MGVRGWAAIVSASMLMTAAPAAAAETPVLVELFTSQSCSSCPPAEAYLGELARRPGVVAVEWHVDYWDHLVHGFHGQWKDPFSDPANTQRQRGYAGALSRRSVYTPQAVVAGRFETVGSDRSAVEARIADARRQVGTGVFLSAKRSGDRVDVRLDGPAPEGGSLEVVLLALLDRDVTEVARGENHGRRLANHNVVLSAALIGRWTGGAAQYQGALPETANRCAVIVQQAGPGPVDAAAYCSD